MKQKLKIAIVTGTRAEYGLLYWLMREVEEDPDLELQVVVTGMHLSPEFGSTYKLIEADGFNIAAKVEMLLSSDSSVGTAKSVGLGIIGFTDVFDRLSPDVIVLLGDRFESLAVAQTALMLNIPLAHIHGGELSEGAIDDAIRHSITKMSHLHFVAAEPYRKRVIQLGESPQRVFNVGAPGLERIKRSTLLTQREFETKFNIKFHQQNFLVTYLPATLNVQENEQVLMSLFSALNSFPDARIIFTKANADEAGRLINHKIDEFVAQHAERMTAYVTLGDLNYLSLLQYVDVVIGNSSSGLIEVPYFSKPTVNIGNRQHNRLRAHSVIDCDGKTDEIVKSIDLALSDEFNAKIKTINSPYLQDSTAKKIKSAIKEFDFSTILMKHFHDVEKVEA